MGDTLSGVVARRMWPGELTDAPGEPQPVQSDTAANHTPAHGGAQKPQSGYLDGVGGLRRGGGVPGASGCGAGPGTVV